MFKRPIAYVGIFLAVYNYVACFAPCAIRLETTFERGSGAQECPQDSAVYKMHEACSAGSAADHAG
jgi:hypothetical protein